MNRTSFFSFIAAGLSAFPLAALAETAPATPAKQPSALANAYMVALIQKCLDHGVLLPDEVQAMTDTELNAALTECANNLPTTQAASAPAVVEQSAPVVVRRRKAVVVEEAPTFVQEAPSQVNVGHILSALGEVGNAGPGEISSDPLDARIDGLQSGIKEGIETSALTPNEAAILNARLARIQAARANLGDTPASRLIVQRQVNAAVADFNRKVHNDTGIPNPDLFRTFKRKGGATAEKNKADTDRLAAIRDRINKKGLVVHQTGESRFEKMKKRREAQEAAVAPTKMRCFRAPCGPTTDVKKTDKGTKNVFVQQRIERLKKQKAAAGNETASVNKNATVQTRKANGRNILIHRVQKTETAAPKKETTNVFKRRRIAQH